jgi:hypothetical protein
VGQWVGLIAGLSTLAITLIRLFEVLWSPVISASLRVKEFWPSLPSSLEYQTNASTQVVSGGFRIAEIQVAGLDVSTRLVYGLEALSWGLAFGVAFFVLFRLALAVSRGSEFRNLSSRWLQFAGAFVIISGLIGSVAQAVARFLLSEQMFGQSESWKADETIANPWLPPSANESDSFDVYVHQIFGATSRPLDLGASFDLPIWPLAIGLTILLISVLLKRGERLSAELEDLI